jgi:hypothetical protein
VAASGPYTYQPTYGQAATGTASSLLNNLSSYMSPYVGSVVDGALRDYDFGAGQTRAQNRLALAGDETFGGSGGAIQTALSEDAIDRGRGALSSNLLNQGYQSAAGFSNLDADRRQAMELANLAAQNQFGLANAQATNEASRYNAQAFETMLQRQQAAAAGLANSAAQQGADERGNIATQAAIGDALRQVQQAQLQAPLSLLTAQSSMLGSLPLNLFSGSVQDGTMNGVTKTKETGASLGELIGAAQFLQPILKF